MAHDISLIVGFDYESSQADALKQIIKEIDAFVGEPKVAKIKFEIEESGLKDLDRIRDTLKSIGTAGIGINTQGGFHNVVQETKDLTDNIGEANSTLQQFARIASGINSDKAREVADALRFDGVTDSKFINKVASDLASLSGEVQKVSVKWRDFGEDGEYAAAVTAQSVDELGNSFSRTINYIKTFDEEGEEVWDRQVRGQATLKTEALQTADAIKNETREMNEFYQISQSIEALRSKIIGASQWTAALGGGEATKEAYYNIQNLTGELNRLDQAHQNHTASNESVKASIRGLNVEYQKQANVIKEAGANQKSFIDRMGSITQVVARYFTVYRVFWKAVNTIKDMVKEVIRLDDAMTQLRVVTDNTEAEYSRFSKTVASTAREIGASVKDLIDSTTTYARLGYSLEEASSLSRYTAMLQNVGDIDVSSAQSAITAITKAYDIGADQIESVMDKLVEVGNNYPINVAQLAEGMNNAGSALAAAGNSFEQSLALLAAANTTVQNISKASTGLRTVVARLRNTKTELDDLGEAMTTAQYDEIVQALTDYNVKLTDSNGELRGTYEIFEDLSKAWVNMTSLEKSALAKTLAGNRQQNVFFSLMDQFGEAQKAMKSMATSDGALQGAYDEYMNSITAHINQLKAAFTSLSQTIMNSTLIKFVVDSGTTVITIIDRIASSLGSLNAILLGIAGIGGIKSIKVVAKAAGGVSSIKDAVAAIGLAFPNLEKAIKGVRDGFSLFTTDVRSASDAMAALKLTGEAALKGIGNILSAHPTLALFTGIVALGTALYKFGEYQANAVDRAEEKLKSLKESYSSNESEIESVNEKLEETESRVNELNGLDSLSFSEAEELKRLQQENAELQRRYDLLVNTEKELAKERNTAFISAMKADLNAADEIRDDSQDYGQAVLGITEESYIKQQIKEYKETVKIGLDGANEDIIEYFVKKNKEFQDRAEGISYIPDPSTEDERRVNEWLDYINDFNNLTAMITGSDPQDVFNWITLDNRFYDLTESLRDLGEQGKVTAEDLRADKYKDFIQNLIDVGIVTDDSEESLELVALAFNSMGEAAQTASENLVQYSESFTDLQSALESFASYQTAVNDAISASASVTGLSQEQIDNLTQAYQSLESFDAAKLFENTANGVRLNAEELERLNAEYENNSVEAFTKHLRELQKEIYAGRAQGIDTSALEEEYRATSLLKSQYEGLTSAYNKWLKAKSGSNNRESYEGIGSGYKEMKEILDGGWYGDDDLNTYLDLMLSASERTGDTIRDFEQLNKTIEGTNHSIMDYWKDDGSTDGLFDFLNDVRKKFGETYATINEDGTYSFDLTGDKLQEVADAFGMSTDLVRIFAQALIDAGAKVNLSDLSLEQEINNARESLKEFQKEGKLSKGLNLEFDVETDSLDSVKKTIEDLERERLTIDGETDPELLRQLNSLIAKTKEQYYVRLNAETDGSLDEAARLLNQIYEKTNGTYTIDTQTRNGKDVEDLVKKISELPEETQIAIGIEAPNVGDIDAIISQFNTDGKIPKIPVEFKPETKETDDYLSHVQELTIDDKEFKVKAIDKSTNVINGIINLLKDVKNKEVTVTTKYKYSYSNTSSGGSSSNGSGKSTPAPKAKGTLLAPSRARANGSAYNLFNLKPAFANGKIALAEDEQALVNELGTESIIRDGRWFLIPGGVHQEALKKGDIILSAAQTKALLKTGAAAGHGKVYANGSLLGAYGSGISGSGASRRPIGGYSNSGSKTTKNTVSQNTAKKSTSNKTSDEESEFERLYKYHQHLLAMDAESVEDYLNWLNDAYKKAYKNNEIELDDYYKYEAEVYKGLQDLFKDYLDDVEHEISMRENFKGEAKAIVKLYQQMIDAVQAEIKAARAAGLKDTDDYIQDLQDKYWDYYDAIKDLREDTTEAAKDAVDDLIDYRIDMLKKEADKEKDKIQERLSYLREFYQKQKDLLRDIYDEDKYYEDQAEKRKAVSDIEAEIAKIQYDNSAWAQKRRLELAEDLAKAQKDLDDFEKDHALEIAQEQLDKQLEMQEKALDAETDAIDKSLESAKDIYERALADIRNGSVELYQEMIEYNDLYGDGISESITAKWQDAYVALKDYYDLFDEHYKGINLANATGYGVPTEPSTSWNTHPISEAGSKGTKVVIAGNSSNIQAGSDSTMDDAVKQKVAAAIWRGGYGWGSGSERVRKLTEVFGSDNGIQALVNKGVGKGEAAPGNEYTYLNMRKRFRGYASGTRNALAGIHAIDEKGIETIFESSDGTRYKMFTGGEKVLNAKASNFLYDFANSGGDLLSKILANATSGVFGKIHPITNNINISEGNIIIQGNADRETVSEIRRIKRDSMDTLLKEINRLNKF